MNKPENLTEIGVEFADDADAVNWSNEEDRALPAASKVIEPWGWKVLVMPVRARAVSRGGIIIPQVKQEIDQYLNYVGRIVALGPMAYKAEKYRAMGQRAKDIPKRGDWMIYPIYQYQRIDFRGTKLILLNDDSFLGRIPKGVSPWDFKLEK